MSIKSILRKAAGLVLELPADSTGDSPRDTSEQPFNVMDDKYKEMAPAKTKSVEQIIKDSPGPNLDQITITPDPTQAPTAPAGQVDFASVYQKAGLPAVAFSAEQALDVIHSLPVELPIDVRRATVQATIQAMGKAMGVNTEGVIADAGRKVAALSAYEDLLSHQSDVYVKTLEAKIADIENQMAIHRAEIQKTRELLASAVGMCTTESARLEDVLEFFTMDVQPSRHA